jgi:TolB-like protein
MSAPAKRFYEFGPFRLDVTERMLTREGRPVALTLKAFDTLLLLVENCGHLVEKEKLLDTVWRDSFVNEGVLSVNIFYLPKALGEEWIETVPRRGYRFVAPVTERWEELHTAAAPAAFKSIAVLPFKALSSDQNDEFLGLGIADALITKLSRIQSLIVRPTSAVRKYTSLEQDAVDVAQQLMVEAVLEGSIRQAGERIRILIQLSAREGTTLWAEQFDERFTDIFTFEDRISNEVTSALLLRLSGAEKKQLTLRPTEDTETYRLYLKGRYFWNKRTEGDLQKGIQYNRAPVVRQLLARKGPDG